MLIEITDPADSRLADYTQLKDVALRSALEPERGLYMAESTQVIGRALAAGHRPRSLLLAERWLPALRALIPDLDAGLLPVFVAAEPVLQAITGFHLHRGALAAMRRPAPLAVADALADARRVVVLDGLVDHTNVGAIFRSAAGLGFDAVLLSPDCADPLYRRSVRVSMGAVFAIPWARIQHWPADVEMLHENGFTVAALALTPSALPLDEFASNSPKKLALVLGSEGHGLKPHVIQACDVVVEIPMAHGIDSLNVAAAAAVACHALRR